MYNCLHSIFTYIQARIRSGDNSINLLQHMK